MFRFAMSPTFWMKVQAEVTDPTGKDDRRVVATFELQVKRMLLDEWKTMLERARAEGVDDNTTMHEIITDWRGLVDADSGEPIPFSKGALDQLLNWGFGAAILQTYGQQLPKAKLKN